MHKKPKGKMVGELVGRAYPAIESLGDDSQRFRRWWIVRTTQPVPSQPELLTLSGSLSSQLEARIRATAEGVSEHLLRRSLPCICITAIDVHHCVVAIDLPLPEVAVGDSAGIGTWGTLRGIDEALGIADLQGLPKRMWFQLES